MEISLRSYQEEVVQAALKGKNSIIWLPTGGGKTRAAVYVAKRHLATKPNAKVAVLVNKVHLVDQHYNNEFKPYLDGTVNIASISGDSQEKDFFGLVVRDSDLVICTAQILENALISKEEIKQVELTDFTLLIIDECHHTHKEGVYNKIMMRYVNMKVKGQRNLPQILGLTASPGTGGARSLDGAVDHVLHICANLDSVIVSTKNYIPDLKDAVPKPKKRYDIVNELPFDPFGSHLKVMMSYIHDYMSPEQDLDLREMGTQEYEADVVELEKKAVQLENRRLALCALHLRKYNDALLISDTVRRQDALTLLGDFYNLRNGRLDDADTFLSTLFQDNVVELMQLATDPKNENPKLARLQRTLVEQFQDRNSRGIIFVKTRVGTRCLNDWVHANEELQRNKIVAAVLVGAGIGPNHMTQKEQKDTIQKFRDGTLNLLISTTVAEEGLDIKECNVVIRYGLLTNEIAQQQASGRARAKDSVYSVVAKAGSREERKEKTNEYLEELTSSAIEKVQRMDPREFDIKIHDLQKKTVTLQTLQAKQREEKRLRFRPDVVQFLCRSCFTPVAHGSDMRIVNDSQHVNINPNFKSYYKCGGQVCLERKFEDWEPGRTISCAKCEKDWGYEIKLKQTVLVPCLKIKSFSLKTAEGSRTVKQWKQVEFQVKEFDYFQYASENMDDFDME